MCSKFEEGLTLEIKEKMSVSGSQSYKEVVQLALRAEKLISKRMSQGKFNKRKGFGFVSSQSSKKSRSFDSFGTLLDLGLILLVLISLFDHHNHLSWKRHHRVLLLRVG